MKYHLGIETLVRLWWLRQCSTYTIQYEWCWGVVEMDLCFDGHLLEERSRCCCGHSPICGLLCNIHFASDGSWVPDLIIYKGWKWQMANSLIGLALEGGTQKKYGIIWEYFPNIGPPPFPPTPILPFGNPFTNFWPLGTFLVFTKKLKFCQYFYIYFWGIGDPSTRPLPKFPKLPFFSLEWKKSNVIKLIRYHHPLM